MEGRVREWSQVLSGCGRASVILSKSKEGDPPMCSVHPQWGSSGEGPSREMGACGYRLLFPVGFCTPDTSLKTHGADVTCAHMRTHAHTHTPFRKHASSHQEPLRGPRPRGGGQMLRGQPSASTAWHRKPEVSAGGVAAAWWRPEGHTL